jgi:uroporphyrinogen III methyltransferase/synthase
LSRGVAGLFSKPIDWVTVTSASCVDHLFDALRAEGKERLFKRLRFASIGPVTSAAVRAHGGHVAVEANASTIEGLVEALLRHQQRDR